MRGDAFAKYTTTMRVEQLKSLPIAQSGGSRVSGLLLLPNEFAPLKNPPDFITIHLRPRSKQKLSAPRSRFTFALPTI